MQILKIICVGLQIRHYSPLTTRHTLLTTHHTQLTFFYLLLTTQATAYFFLRIICGTFRSYSPHYKKKEMQPCDCTSLLLLAESFRRIRIGGAAVASRGFRKGSFAHLHFFLFLWCLQPSALRFAIVNVHRTFTSPLRI